jgi:hypothetical protein
LYPEGPASAFRANKKFMKFMKANHHHEVYTIKKSDPVFTEDLIDEISALFIDE